jgi:general secretion pathway protein K
MRPTPAPTRARRRQHGAALLLAMIIVVLVATVSAGMVWQQTRALSIEAAERARAQSAWILNGALDWARLILREDERSNRQQPRDSLDEPWATPLAEARLSSFLAADKDNNADGGPEAFISGSISDAQARYNLRNVIGEDGKPVVPEVAALQRLCSLVGVPSDTASRIVQALADAASWRLQPPEGAGAEAPARPEDPPLQPARPADLAWAGLAPATLARLSPYVDLLPQRTPVNLNTAPREVIVAAIDGIDPGTAERLVQARQRKPFNTLDAVREHLPPETPLEPTRVSVASAYFEVAGRLRLEERVLEERSLLVRRNGRVDVLRRERLSFATDSP